MNNDPAVVPYQSHIIIFDRKSSVCMENDVKDTKHTIQIARRMNIVRNGK